MVFKLITTLVILCLLSTINCDTICNELHRNNQSIDFAFTEYYDLKSIKNIQLNHTLVINAKVWNINVSDVHRFTIRKRGEALSYSYEDFLRQMIQNNYTIAVEVANVNSDYSVWGSIQIYFNGTTFYYIVRQIREGEFPKSFTINANQYNISVPFSALSVAFIPDSFRHDFDKQFSVIFVEQKSQKQLPFEREFHILKFNITSNSEVNITLEDANILPKFLAQIPDSYYINGILNTYEYKRCKVSNNCSFSAIVLFTTIDGIMKYCITAEDELSENCLENNTQTLLFPECDDWMYTTSITTKIGSTLNLITTSIKPKENHKNRVFIVIIIILSVIFIVCIIGCLSAYLIYRYCAKKQSKRRIVIKGNKNKETVRVEQKKNENKNKNVTEKDLIPESDISLKEESQETFGFDTTDQTTLDLNEPIYVRNEQ